MTEVSADPKSYEDFNKVFKPILTRVAAECQRFEKRPLRLKHNKEIMDAISKLLLYARSRESAANTLKLENQKLRAQVAALQAVLTPIVAASKATTAGTTYAPQIPADRTEPKEVVQ